MKEYKNEGRKVHFPFPLKTKGWVSLDRAGLVQSGAEQSCLVEEMPGPRATWPLSCLIATLISLLCCFTIELLCTEESFLLYYTPSREFLLAFHWHQWPSIDTFQLNMKISGKIHSSVNWRPYKGCI